MAGRRIAGRGPQFAAAAAVGAPVARALWFALWGGLAWLAVLAARGPGLLPDQDPAPAAGMSSGEPRWLRSLDAAASGLLGQHAALAGLVSASLFAVIAVGVYLPVPAARAVLCLAVLAAVAMWAGGQDLGGLFTRATTDPDTGPLLVLLAAAYWPVPRMTAGRAGARDVPGSRGPRPGSPSHAADGGAPAARKSLACCNGQDLRGTP